jgi:hypothetical protein
MKEQKMNPYNPGRSFMCEFLEFMQVHQGIGVASVASSEFFRHQISHDAT